MHRADASGSSHLFGDYHSRHSETWRREVGASIRPTWPVGEAGQGSDGLASLVQRTRASIGYVEYSYARPRRLAVAALLDRDGRDTRPGLESFKAAAGAADWSGGDDLSPSLVDLQGPNCWPITSATHVPMRARADSPMRSRALLAFFDWALTLGGAIAEAQDYVPLPAPALQRIRATWRERLRDANGAPL